MKAAAQKGSEPTRNSFYRARVMFSDDPEIPELVTKIAAFQEAEMPDKMLSFYSDLMLNPRRVHSPMLASHLA